MTNLGGMNVKVEMGDMNEKIGRDGLQSFEGWVIKVGGMDDKVGKHG